MGATVIAALVLSVLCAGIASNNANSSRTGVEVLTILLFITSVTILPAFQMVGLVDLSDSVLISFQAAILLTVGFIIR